MATRVLPTPPDGAPADPPDGRLADPASGPAAHPTVVRSPPLPNRLGRYELLVPLGAGGMAEVWIAGVAGDLGLRKLVALKRILPEHAGNALFRAMFLEEARLASRIHHANVVEVLDLGDEGGVTHQVMALVEGSSLSALLEETSARAAALDAPVVIRIVGDVLRGLHAAHTLRDEDVPNGVVHRDVSPQNVLVGLDGVAKIADFGIAKALGSAREHTDVNTLKGKLRYMAPEQLDGEPASMRSDVYSAGVVLWEALTGAALFASTTDRIRRKEERVPDVRTVRSDLPEGVAVVVARALARRPEERFPSALAMADALERCTPRPAPHHDVATVVDACVGDEVRRLWAKARAALRAERPEPSVGAYAGTSPPSEADPTIVERPPRTKARVLAALAIVVVLGIALAAVGLRSNDARQATRVEAPPEPKAIDTAARPAETAETPGTAAPAPVDIGEVATPAPVDIGEVATPPSKAEVAAPRVPVRARPPRPGHAPRPSSSGGARNPTFDNPY